MDEDARQRLSPSFRAELKRTERLAETLVGQSEPNAMAAAALAGITVRVAARDGKTFMLRKDHRPSRVNVTIDDGKVTAVRVG